MTKAAKENHVTQSAVSQAIDKLEIELGKKLISNKRNRFEITYEGELLLEKCDSIFSLLIDIEDLFNEKEGVYRGICKFATSHSFAISLLPTFYKQLFKNYSDVESILRLGHSGIVRDWVLKGDVEFGVILEKEEDKMKFHTQLLLEGTYGLYKTKKICF